MTTTFAACAPRWCSLSARLLGWRPAEFWGATPAELLMAVSEPLDPSTPTPPSRELIARLMERDTHE
ncbi:phage tail assembly chaperone [Porphyrobacter sp. AAP60]|uniref:phage tail assembly chaperone n=1 Tax=Porphyrobacter sp. AAP60 TaxID=1523423 RepID=UPI0006B91ABD|nr:phage tail assembly chaperone [Porphyrobacter sp. AAP60]KPF63003.1 hypothetical protein IP79_10570 [Porphyrobacter sp. AAP60]